jgi:hypothetical protein
MTRAANLDAAEQGAGALSRRHDGGGTPASIRDLLRLLGDAFAGPAWHGPSLRGSLRGVTVAEALWRPAMGRNCVWDLVLHAAYGKHLVAHRLDPAASPRFARRLARAWWPALPEVPDAAAWRRDRALLEEYHGRLVDVVQTLPPARLLVRLPGARHTLGQEIAGIALHDVYHAGQVRLVRRLYVEGGARRGDV